ncbi:hypothetical protein QA641_14140 [Bradyrhizobium sp. CB1650]|uniref:hypothetical protein n=1 Tax=Bradyrhizobium sp. CB1650 TaxID=3039153 RepID=UPI002435CDA7|nr:hypothetical protein [Bradyrhizobium sp. CB1650]WGD54950.1 hypothetical protein QA641_14140 [Bradyrhizobium sp. CB1650]
MPENSPFVQVERSVGLRALAVLRSTSLFAATAGEAQPIHGHHGIVPGTAGTESSRMIDTETDIHRIQHR